MSVSISNPIHWTCWQPTPYNDVLFKTLAAGPCTNLLVHFREGQVPSHPWQSAFAEGYESRVFRPVLGVDWRLLWLAAFDRRGIFVVAGWQDLTSLLTLVVLMALRRPYLIWTDTPNHDDSSRSFLKRHLRIRWLGLVFRRARAVLGTGTLALDTLYAMGCARHKLRNLPYVIDLAGYQPVIRQLGMPVTFVSSGRLHEDKGYDVALRALALVYAHNPGGFIYRIAGRGPERDRLERLAEQLAIGGQVEFVDWLEPHALSAFYQAADIFLHPARREPYGVAVLEAMASGLIVIGSDATAAAVDRIVDGTNGFLHRSGDHRDLARAIDGIISDPDAFVHIRVAARATAETWPASRAAAEVCSVLLPVS